MMVRQLDANDAAAYQDLRLRALHESPTVAQDFRRRGFGRALLAAAIAYAHSVDGVLQLKISVNSQNAAARLLYQSVGFKRLGVEPNALLVDGQFYDEEHYVLPVDVCTEPPSPQN
jgi:RimJ/RimL family protein N-acetyltransferase